MIKLMELFTIRVSAYRGREETPEAKTRSPSGSLNFKDNKTISPGTGRSDFSWERERERPWGRACGGMDICQSPELSPLFFFPCALLPFTFTAHAFTTRLYDTHTYIHRAPLAPLPPFLTSSLPPVARHATIRSSCKTALRACMKSPPAEIGDYNLAKQSSRSELLTNFSEQLTQSWYTSLINSFNGQIFHRRFS